MQKELLPLLDKNKQWAKRMKDQDPLFFQRLAEEQKPKYLWIGCSDSRVPGEVITNTQPGEVFDHRNIANLVHHNDTSMLSVLQYSVEVLKVRHIIVCGHYGCGGVKASLETTDHGLVDNWIRPLKELYEEHKTECEGRSESEIVDLLCEWNVRRQVMHVAQSTILQKAWKYHQHISVHGLIYSLKDGLLGDLGCRIDHAGEVPDMYHIR